MLPHSRVELGRWFDSHKVGDCVAERGSGSTRDPLEALVTPLVIRPSVIEVVKPRRYRVAEQSSLQQYRRRGVVSPAGLLSPLAEDIP